MADVTVKRRIKAPVQEVFASWNNEFGDIYKFNPNLNSSHLLSDLSNRQRRRRIASMRSG